MQLNFQDTFSKELPADPKRDNTRRQVLKACFSFVTPRVPSDPKMIHVSDEMLEAIGLTVEDKDSEEFLEIFSGAKVPEGSEPYAMCYGGHQFGNWAGQLGDGRAINLGEVIHQGERWALQLKGAGETPYARSADGLAVLRSSIREHLCSEAMHHLGVPTTRSLSLALTGDQVLRDILYNGNSEYEPGAVVCRVSPSFIRFGHYQILAARQDTENLKKLVDYTIRYYYPHLSQDTTGYIQFFKEVSERTLDMVIHWQRVGFVHGVMNTDNMSILGLTIDYGPYGWLEGYEPGWTPNTTDRSTRRYRYGHQPAIALWNLAQLGSALMPIINDAQPLQSILDLYKTNYRTKYLNMMRRKLGLQLEKVQDQTLVSTLDKTLQLVETDMTIFFRKLAEVPKDMVLDENNNFLEIIGEAFYSPNLLTDQVLLDWKNWFEKYLKRLSLESWDDTNRRDHMLSVNPKYVLRNYMAQMAIDQAELGQYELIDELYRLLKQPYANQPDQEKWFAKRPEWARHKVGCSMLSCSS